MRLKVITSTNDPYKCFQLEKSLKKFGYDYHIIEHPWYGFLSKIHETYKYVKTLEGYTHFLYTDAWDTIATGQLDFVPGDEIIISAERACYPHPELASQYPEVSSPWKYVNGGGWLCSIKRFIELYEMDPPTNEMNDQVYLTRVYLKYKDQEWMKLDTACEAFQTIAFCEFDRDFELTEREGKVLRNKITDSYPVFWHGNGHTPMDKLYELQ